MAEYNQMILDNLARGAAKAGEVRANVGNPNQRLVWKNGAWEDAGAAPATAPQAGAMSAPRVTYSNPSAPTYKIQPMPDAAPSQQASQLSPDVMASIGNLATMGTAYKPTSRQDILDMANSGAAASPKATPAALPNVLTPGAIKPGLDAGGRVIDERGGMGGPSVMAPTLSVNSGGQASQTPAATAVAPKAARPTGDLPAAIQAAKDYTPGAMAAAPGFKNYYATETQPFDAAYEATLRNNVINTAEQQYKQGADRVRSMLASRGLMAGGGTGLEAAMMGQLAMEASGARERGLNQVALDTAQKRADFNMRRAEGMMSAQRDEFGRYVDQLKLPLLLDEQKARVKSALLQNGVDQYAAERLMEMDANEWPDLLKNILKGALIGGGVYTGNPALVAAGAGWR